MTDPEAARALFAAGAADLKALEHMSDEEAFVSEVFGFHAQQAVEKMLKAWICTLGEDYPRIHDLGHLMSLLVKMGEEASEFRDLKRFTTYAVIFRYDIDEARIPPFDRQVAVRRICALRDVVRGIVPE